MPSETLTHSARVFAPGVGEKVGGMGRFGATTKKIIIVFFFVCVVLFVLFGGCCGGITVICELGHIKLLSGQGDAGEAVELAWRRMLKDLHVALCNKSSTLFRFFNTSTSSRVAGGCMAGVYGGGGEEWRGCGEEWGMLCIWWLRLGG